MIGVLGGLIYVVFETTLEVLFYALKLIALALQLGGVAVWCGNESDRANVCRHAWVVWLRAKLGYNTDYNAPPPAKPKGLSIAADIQWRRDHAKR